MPHLPLHSTHAGTLSINSLVGEPQAGVHMLDVRHRVSILDVRRSHPIQLLPHTQIQLFLRIGGMRHSEYYDVTTYQVT